MSTQLEKLKIFKAINNIEILMHLLKTIKAIYLNHTNVKTKIDVPNKIYNNSYLGGNQMILLNLQMYKTLGLLLLHI